VKNTSLIASLAVAGLLVLPGGALADSHAPKKDGPKGNAYGKMVKKKVKKKCENKKGKAKKNCVRKTKRKAYGNIIKKECGVSYGQLRKKGREEVGKDHVRPAIGAKKFVKDDLLAAHCEGGEIIVPEEVPEA
jgi:hypothetical protein